MINVNVDDESAEIQLEGDTATVQGDGYTLQAAKVPGKSLQINLDVDPALLGLDPAQLAPDRHGLALTH